MKKVLLIGANGQIGWELQIMLQDRSILFAPKRAQLDLADPKTIQDTVRTVQPAVIINAGAYTAVDDSERFPHLAHQINAVGQEILAQEAKRGGALLITYSTDYVFDGTKNLPYVETDVARPINAYGQSKLAGEQAIIASSAAYLIFRTSWIYAMRGSNFALKILSLARTRNVINVVRDQIGSPTWARYVAESTIRAVNRVTNLEADERLDLDHAREFEGTYHLTATGEASWADFAAELLQFMSSSTKVLPIPSSEYPTLAKRPAYSVLDNSKVQRTFGIEPAPWKPMLQAALREYSG